jgi:hypothetical protein
MKADRQAAAQERDRVARKAKLEQEGERLRELAAQNDVSGKESILTKLPEMSVRERKLQSANTGLLSPSGEPKGRVLSKDEILAARKKR